MSTAMYDAREALIPGSVYDRSNNGEKSLTIHSILSEDLLFIVPVKKGMCLLWKLIAHYQINKK